MARSEIDISRDVGFMIHCIPYTQKVPGDDGIVDEIQMYRVTLQVGEGKDRPVLTERTYANSNDLNDAAPGIRYRVNYFGEVDNAEAAVVAFEHTLWNKLFHNLFKD